MKAFLRPRATRRVSVSVALMLTAMAVLAGCASNAPTSSQQGLPDNLVKQAEQAALAAAGGQKIGGKLSLVGVNGGVEGQLFEKTLKPFEQATGVSIDYTGTSDANTVIQTRVSAGNPPDVVRMPNGGGLKDYAKAGKLVALDGILDSPALSKDFAPALLDAARVDGKLYGMWSEVDDFMVWYNAKSYTGPTSPKDWAQLQTWAKSQTGPPAPWCMGLESGAASGVTGAHFISNLLLYTAGPDALSKLVSGQLSFTSPEVRAAFQRYGEIATSPSLVAGGPQNVLASKTVDAGNGMFSSPQRCSLLGWGNYAGGLITNANPNVKPVTDLNFFAWPAVDTKYSGAQMVSGQVMYAFNDTPQVRAFLKYYASAQAQALLAATGHWVVANNQVSLDVYPNELIRRSAQVYKDSTSIALAPVTVLPTAVVLAFYRGVVSYVQNPGNLDAILAGIEQARPKTGTP